VSKAKWQPPPDLRAPPRDPKAAMLKDGAWYVFTIDRVACLFEKQRLTWPNERTGRKELVGIDWVPHGPVETAQPCDCLNLANIRAEVRAEVRDFQRGFT
jgi:hypothetical protein